MVRIGTAGWAIPSAHAALAPGPGTHLERYARTLRCTEVNSSFYRSHRLATWQRWADSTPEDFRFSVKLPKAITHTAKLAIAPAALDDFLEEIAALGSKLGPILVQLPPSLRFDDCPAAEFFEALRERFHGPVALEPRHATWLQGMPKNFWNNTDRACRGRPVARPASRPGQLPIPGGWAGLAYFRLHGSPRTYYSSYDGLYLRSLADAISALPAATETWVIFDNTGLGHAFGNALDLQRNLDNIQPSKRAKPKPHPNG